jgi:hypothetical protein
MAGTPTHVAQAHRLGAALGVTIDLSKVMERHAPSSKEKVKKGK